MEKKELWRSVVKEWCGVETCCGEVLYREVLRTGVVKECCEGVVEKCCEGVVKCCRDVLWGSVV